MVLLSQGNFLSICLPVYQNAFLTFEYKPPDIIPNETIKER